MSTAPREPTPQPTQRQVAERLFKVLRARLAERK